MKSFVFHDIDHFNDFAKPWDRELRKLNKGNEFEASINLIHSEDIMLVEIGINGIVEQKGSIPKNMLSFLIPANDRQSFYWRNNNINGNHVGIYPSGSEMMVVSNSGFNVFVVSVAESTIIDQAARMQIDWPSLNNDQGKDRIIPDDNLLKKSRRLIRRLFDLKRLSSDRLYEYTLFVELKFELLKQLILMSSSLPKKYQPDKSNRLRVFQRARDFIFSNPALDFRMDNLCEYTASCERTLQYAIKYYTGLTPTEYVKAHKLNLVRDELLSCDPLDTKISEIALRYGFLHASQFSHDYKQIFQELPSDTLKKYSS
jgi:AraC family ethanolamine operon transcriptional activator